MRIVYSRMVCLDLKIKSDVLIFILCCSGVLVSKRIHQIFDLKTSKMAIQDAGW